MIIHENLRQKCLIFLAMCFTIYGPQKALFLRNFFLKTHSKISKLYASASMHHQLIYGILCGLPGHGSIDILNWRYALRKYFMTNFVRLCANFRDFELIVARTYKLILLQSIIFYQWLIDMTSSVAWHCIHLDMYGKTV